MVAAATEGSPVQAYQVIMTWHYDSTRLALVMTMPKLSSHNAVNQLNHFHNGAGLQALKASAKLPTLPRN